MKSWKYYKGIGIGILPIKYNQGMNVSKFLVNSVFDCRAGRGNLLWGDSLVINLLTLTLIITLTMIVKRVWGFWI